MGWIASERFPLRETESLLVQLPCRHNSAATTFLALAMIPVSQPTADGCLIARILLLEVPFEKSFLSRDNHCPDEAGSWNEHYQQPKVIQPN